MKFRDKLIRFMQGRYGPDQFYRFLTYLFFILCIINIFLNSIILYTVIIGVALYQYLRFFSKNIAARRRENQIYLKVSQKVKKFFKTLWLRIKDIGKWRYRTCPKCGATLRLPIKRGKHTANCPRCSTNFKVNIRI